MKRAPFTGADSRRKGLFEIADGGTVYLDEINSIPVVAGKVVADSSEAIFLQGRRCCR
ncbi:MAG: sigma 54-interacting transcriptional regulator [Bacteroidales bacterium]